MRQFVQNQPKLKFNRTQIPLTHRLRTSMTVGKLYPIDCQEVLPGDTWTQDEQFLCRLSSTYIRPIMDDLYLDVYSFFVPLRLLQENYESVFGKQGSWETPLTNSLAHTETRQLVRKGSVADYLGLPVGYVPAGISVLPFRAFAMIYDTKFRKEMYEDPMYIFKNDIGAEVLNDDEWSVTNYTGKLPNVSRYPDLFTTSSIKPQRGPAIPLIAENLVPVICGNPNNGNTTPLHIIDTAYGDGVNGTLFALNGQSRAYGQGLEDGEDVTIDNLYARLNQTVNETRIQFQLQKMLERDMIYGTRYNEYLLGHYGVNNGDARMQIPEFLAGSHTQLNTQQVTQTSASEADSALASLAGYSQTYNKNVAHFSKSFTEHGYVMTVACIRYKHTYTQGLNPLWTRTRREHFFDPLFANLGAQPVYMEQIFASDVTDTRKDVFGYNEAWSDYRTIVDRASGEFRDYTGAALLWSLSDHYANRPNPTQLYKETDTRFNTTVTVSTDELDPFYLDIIFNVNTARILPPYSEPGRIDH